MQWLMDGIGSACRFFVTESVAQSGPLMVVGTYAGLALVLYGLTRGREFLMIGYASVLFLAPFLVH